MGIRERRNGEKAEMKKKIMEAAIEIINTDGYEKLSIRKIAAKIQYSPTAIYLYYKDKAQIITDMADELYNNIEENTAAILKASNSLPPDKVLGYILLEFIKSLSGEPEMAKAIIYSGMNVIFANHNNNPVPDNRGIHLLNELCSKGIEQEVLRPGINKNSWMIVSALLGFVISVIENRLYLLDNFNELSHSFVDMLMEGIGRYPDKSGKGVIL